MIANKFASYKNANETANGALQKTRQVVLLYDATIRYLQQAKEAILAKDFEKRFNLTQKASNIIVGLHSALDFDKGGNISQTLSDFYTHIDLQIINLNRSDDLNSCENIIKELQLMRDAWDKVDREQAPAPKAKPSEGDNNGGANFSA